MVLTVAFPSEEVKVGITNHFKKLVKNTSKVLLVITEMNFYLYLEVNNVKKAKFSLFLFLKTSNNIIHQMFHKH